MLYIIKVKVLVVQSCLTLCKPMDCSSLGSSVHGILQAMEWLAMPSSKGSSQPRDQTLMSYVSCIGSGFFTINATWEKKVKKKKKKTSAMEKNREIE